MAPRRLPRSGFTLVEVLVALAIGMVVLAACYEFMSRARQSAETGMSRSRLEVESNDLVQRIADLLRQASPSSPDWAVSEDGSSITYNLCEGAPDGSPLWSAPFTLSALPTEGDPGAEGDDGIDNDGDGLVDERVLVALDAGTGSELEAWAVNLQTLQISQDGRTLAVSVTLQESPLGGEISPETVSAATSVYTRN